MADESYNFNYEALENNTYGYTPYTNKAKYFVYKGRKYFVQFPSEVNSETTIYVAGHGNGDNGITHPANMFAATKNKNVIVIEPVKVDNMSDFTNIPEIAEEFAKHYNIDPPTITMSGHSATGVNSIKGAEAVIKATNSPTVLVLNDGHNTHTKVKIDSSVFKDSIVIGFRPETNANLVMKKNGVSTMDRLKEIAKAGGKVIVCTYHNTTPVKYGPTKLDHGASNAVAVALGTYDLENLQFVDNGTVHFRKHDTKAYYTYQYIDEKGKLHDFKNAEEVQKYYEEARVVMTGSLYDKCSNLAEFAEKYKGDGSTLGSNLSYVSDAMNAIKSKITEHTDINYISDGEASIVGTLYKASNYYGAVTNVLYGNLSAEAEAVYAIADAIFKMDGAASYIAETTLSDGMTGLFSKSNPTVSTALNELKTTSANLLDTAKTAVMAGGRYDELSSLLGETIQEGGVGRISTKSLETAISTIIPNLENEIAKATGIKASVSEFMTGIGTSNILQGETWEAVKTNMANYENLLDCNVKAATFISDTIKTAMGMITNYISGAAETLKRAGTTDFGAGISLDEIDDSKLPALEAELVKLQTEIDRIAAIVSTMEASRHEVADKKQNDEGEWVIIGSHQEPSEAEIQGYRDQLTKVQDIKDILDAYAGVLRGFAPVVKGAQDIINDAVSQVKSAYENPTVDTQGNQTFSSDFSLDLSKYGIDPSIDYKKLAEEYHSDTNPQPASDTTNPDGTEKNPETDKAGDNGEDKNDNPDKTPSNPSNPGGPTNPGNPSSPSGPSSPSSPSSPRDTSTDRSGTEASSSKKEPIEVPTMAPTEPRRETEKPTPTTRPTVSDDDIVIPDTQPPIIEIKDEPEVVRMSSGGYDKKPTNPYVDPLVNPDEPTIIENQDEIIQNQIEEPIIDTGHNEYYEPEIQKPPVVEITPEAEQTIAQPKPGTGVKAMGIASGVGLAVGALALGAHAIIKKDEKELDEEDFGYDK